MDAEQGQRLIELACEARGRAHSPYSEFAVGAVIEADDGRLFSGCNVENASLGLTICAERVAVGAAIAAGSRSWLRLVLVTAADPPAAPCGSCRQVLAEFCDELEIVLSDGTAIVETLLLSKLLPHRFGPESLGVPPV